MSTFCARALSYPSLLSHGKDTDGTQGPPITVALSLDAALCEKQQTFIYGKRTGFFLEVYHFGFLSLTNYTK